MPNAHRSISGIRSCEQKVLLQPDENYLFYIKAANEAGTSEQSEAALISTKGDKPHAWICTFFTRRPFEFPHEATFIPFQGQSSSCSKTRLTLLWSCQWIRPPCTTVTTRLRAPDLQTESELQSSPASFLSPVIFKSDCVSRCPSILGEPLLPRGRYYWETIVSRSTAYRLGVAYSTASRSSPLGENSLSWCLQCVPTMSGCVFIQFQTFLPFPPAFWTRFIFLCCFSLSQLQVSVAAHHYSVQFVCDRDARASGHSSRLPARPPVFLQRPKWSAVRHFLPAIYSAMSPCPGPGHAGKPGGQHSPEDARFH